MNYSLSSNIFNFHRCTINLLRTAWYHTGRALVDAAQRIFFNMNIVYHQPISPGAKIIAANHCTTFDPVMITTLVPERMSILISETIFKMPVAGMALKAGGHIRVVHSHGRPALDEAVKNLNEGITVGIFPEGALSPWEGGLAPAHSGTARMALLTGAPVYPAGIAVSMKYVRKKITIVDGVAEEGFWMLHGPYIVTVGTPLLYRGNPNDQHLVKEITQDIMQHITRLQQESSQRLLEAKFTTPSLLNWLGVMD